MTSNKQIAANRRNSQGSTGPKTDSGKLVSSKNAIKHGLLSSETLLPWEDGTTLQELRTGFLNTLQPEDHLEEILVDRIISLSWRLRRAGHLETSIFAFFKYQDEYSRACLNSQALENLKNWTDFPREKDQEIITDNQVHALIKMLEKGNLLNSDLSKSGKTFGDAAQTLNNLHRHEAGLERSLFKTLHELQRLQGIRKGQSIFPPVVVDVQGDTEALIP